MIAKERATAGAESAADLLDARPVDAGSRRASAALRARARARGFGGGIVALVRASAILFTAQLAGVLRSKRALVGALLCLIPVAMVLFAVHLPQRIELPPSVALGWYLEVQVIVPLLALILGSAVVAGEVEDRTITYLFTRPIPRASVLLGRWLAALVVLVLLLVPSTLAMLLVLDRGLPFGQSYPVPAGVVGPLLCSVLLGGAVYSAVFAAAGTFLRHPMIAGLGYVFAIEVFLANLPGSSQALTLQYYLRSYVVAYGSTAWRDLEAFSVYTFEPGPAALLSLLGTLVVSLGAGAWIVSRKQYVLSS